MLDVEIRTDIKPKDFFPNEPKVILYAFSVGERHYFHFDDALNVPYDRALKTLIYQKELDCNIDRAFLEQHQKAVDAILTTQPFTTKDLLKIYELNNLLGERFVLPKEPDLMYKYAAVIFFDQHENPRTYEFKYGERKIHHWKKNVNITDFFLSVPLRTLIPYLQKAGENLLAFSQMVEKSTAEHSAKVSAILSTKSKPVSIKL